MSEEENQEELSIFDWIIYLIPALFKYIITVFTDKKKIFKKILLIIYTIAFLVNLYSFIILEKYDVTGVEFIHLLSEYTMSFIALIGMFSFSDYSIGEIILQMKNNK